MGNKIAGDDKKDRYEKLKETVNEELKKAVDRLRKHILCHPYYIEYVKADEEVNKSIQVKMIKSDIDEKIEILNRFKQTNLKNQVKLYEEQINIKRNELNSLPVVIDYRYKRKRLLSLLKRLQDEVLSKMRGIWCLELSQVNTEVEF